MLSNKFKSVLCISFLFFSFSAAATNQAQETAAKKSESSVEVIEVRGDNSLLMLRAQTRARQRAFYNELNSMLEDELFHVHVKTKELRPERGLTWYVNNGNAYLILLKLSKMKLILVLTKACLDKSITRYERKNLKNDTPKKRKR